MHSTLPFCSANMSAGTKRAFASELRSVTDRARRDKRARDDTRELLFGVFLDDLFARDGDAVAWFKERMLQMARIGRDCTTFRATLQSFELVVVNDESNSRTCYEVPRACRIYKPSSVRAALEKAIDAAFDCDSTVTASDRTHLQFIVAFTW